MAQWIDCATLFVDVPLDDIEVALLAPGDWARVMLEGERAFRDAVVVMTRRSASALGTDDLAAVSTARNLPRAQALLSLAAPDLSPDRCTVGRSAFVDVDKLGLIAVLRARLRL